jgi:hypothetical protein
MDLETVFLSWWCFKYKMSYLPVEYVNSTDEEYG